MKPEPEYEVGYGRPPRDTRFKIGRSGNPAGRPRGAKNLSTLLNSTLNEPVSVSENGRRRKITKREAILKQLVNKAAAGDPRSIQLLLGEIRTMEASLLSSHSDGAPLDEADLKVLHTLAERLQGLSQGGDQAHGGAGDAASSHS